MDLDDPAGGSTEGQSPPPPADDLEMVELLLVSSPSPPWALPPPSAALCDPLPWPLSSSPIYSPPRRHHMLPRVVDLAGDADLEEDDSEMMPASDPSRLFQSWSTMPMGVGMLWSFDDGARISYPEIMSSAAPPTPQLNFADKARRRIKKKSGTFANREIYQIVASLRDEIETMRCYLKAPDRSEYMVITLVNQFLEVVSEVDCCLMDLPAMRGSLPSKAKQIEELTAKVEDISQRIVPYRPIEPAGHSRMLGAATLCTAAAQLDYISALMKQVFSRLKMVGDSGLRIWSQDHAFFCENHEQNNSTCAQNSEGSYCSASQNNSTRGCRVQQHEKGRKGISAKQRSKAGSVVWLHFSKNSSNVPRHPESVHQMDLSAHSEAAQRSSCSQVLQTREIAENATPLIKNERIVVDCEQIKLGNNDVKARIGKLSRKCNKYTSGSKSEVWLHFEKLVSVEDSGVKAKCIYCDKVLKADSKRNGTSRLRRHIIGCHKIEFAGSLIIKKRQSKNKNELASTHNQDKDQASPDCHRFNSIVRAASANGPSHQGLQFTEIVGNPMPSTKKKSAEVQPSNKSRKHTKCTSRSRSKVWLHFSRVANIKDPCVIKAKCRHCGKLFRADSKINGTSRLRRHIIGSHKIELAGSVKTTRNCGNDSNVNQEETSIDNQAKDRAAAECRGIEHDKVPREVIVLDSQNSGDAVVKISKPERQIINKIKSTEEEEVLVYIDDVSIQKKVLESLADPMLEDGPPKYLQDDIIDACIHMLRDKNKNDIRAHGKVFIETTMICQLLHKAACSFYPIRGKEIKDHKKYGMQYLKHDMIFLPINQNGNHWYLAVVNTKKQEIQVLDSLGKQLREREELKYTLKQIEQCLELAGNDVQTSSWPDYKVASWKVRQVKEIPEQTDMSSCGLFMIKYLEYWTGEKLNQEFTQSDIDHFRLKLAYELMSSPLNKARR